MQTTYTYSHTINRDNTILREKYAKMEDDDGNIFEMTPHLRRIAPTDDFSEESQFTQALCNFVFTQDIKDKWLLDHPPIVQAQQNN